MRRYRDQNADLHKRLNEIQLQLKDKKIESFEALAKHDEKAKIALIKLAQEAQPITMVGINIGLFGITSTGKSTMLNSLLGQKVAETGVSETTTKITPYPGTQYTLWDVPDRNDEISYLSLEYIAFFKGLSRRLILIQATVKENTSMLRLLDELDLRYDIVFEGSMRN
jgi:GTP-binding protein EngB required for normal cell division